MWNYVHANELYHWGKKGMKWGVRRYQNPDGSLTPEGRRRQERNDRLFSPSLKGGKDKPNISPAEKMAKEAGGITDNASNIVDSMYSLKRSSRKTNVGRMSNQELQAMITRMDLEQKYSSLNSKRVSKGYEYTKEAIAVIGGVVGIVGSGLAIATAVKGLKTPPINP